MAAHDLDFVFHQLGDLREARGALPLAKAEIHVDGALHAKSLRRSAEYASTRTKFVVVDGSAGEEDVEMEVVTTEEKRETTVSCGYHGRTNENGLPRTPVPYMIPQQPITAH
ncbi:hypothetical protein NLJ89_g8948 [Agrocybe chaxingu]|uniref:Uncharacterized protein n=1 Tax=Agrocybe chaxingu TaxID=84603 RepID=A0A9W8MTL9_9AGAR|nr:hypothetical protein NLJ89_g8948 [Agrocybe chaxingu]